MQKVYLLLRSNKQTGPYSIEELLQLNLKPFDLVWVEGRSAAWQYPFEIPALKPYVPETPQAQVPFQPIATSAMEEKLSGTLDFSKLQHPAPQKTELPKKVFVSVPKSYAATSEQKAFTDHTSYMPPAEPPVFNRSEEIKQTISSSSQPASSYPQQKPLEDESVRTHYSRSLNDVEEDYTNWTYKQKTKKKRASVNPKDLVLAVLILAVIGGGYYIMSKPSVANSVLPANKTAVQNAQPVSGNNSEGSVPEEIISTDQKNVPNTNTVLSTTSARQTKNIKTKNPVTVSKSQTNSSVPQVQNSMPVEKTNPNIHNNNNDVATKEPDIKQQPKENAPAEKKKKFGDVIKGIFSKKEKKEETKDETVLEDPKPATNRQATRRDAEDNSSNDTPASNEISTASLMEQIDLSSNAPENWMMGVKNLKVTLRNRSNVTIQTASVAVNYYDENNQLLEKKLLYFNNVAPKGKVTITAPDHKFADHVDFKLTSASAKEDRFARY